jgi:hypothetical protein
MLSYVENYVINIFLKYDRFFLSEITNHCYPKLGYHILRPFLYNFLAFI